MARVVKVTATSNIYVDVVTKFEDGSSSTKTIKVGDTVEGLRWNDNDEVKTVTGVVSDISYRPITGNTAKANPDNTFSKNIVLKNIIVDASTQYNSNVVSVPVANIIEDDGVENVTRVDVISKLGANTTIEYSDDTVKEGDLEVGDLLSDVVIMGSAPGKSDITGKFYIKSFLYTVTDDSINVVGMNLVNSTTNVKVSWDRIIKFNELPSVIISGEGMAAVAELLASDEPEVSVTFNGNVVVPDRPDGRITTVMIPEGKTLNVNLAGNTLDVAGYAFYSTGGTIIIDDTTGNGVIKTRSHKTYGAVYSKNGKIIINGGKIDTSTPTDAEDPNYMYGIVLSGSATVEMNGGEVHTVEASGASITNGTAEGVGAIFEFGGNAKLTADKCYAIYMADNKKVIVKDNAVVEGICMRMGDIEVRDNGKVINNMNEEDMGDFGAYLTNYNGVEACRDGILVMGGMYNSVGTGTNDVNITISDNGYVSSKTGPGIGIAKVSAKYDQVVNVSVNRGSNVKGAANYDNIHVYEFEECQAIAAASGKTITKGSEVTVTIDVAGTTVYPVNA